MFQQDEAERFFSDLSDAVVAIAISRFVVEIPAQNARVVLEFANHALDVGFEQGFVLGDILEGIEIRRLHPARVMPVWSGSGLFAELGK